MVMRLVLCWELIVSANVDPVDFGIAGIYKEAYDPSGLRKSQRCGASCVHIVYAKKNNRITRYKSGVVLKVSSTKHIHESWSVASQRHFSGFGICTCRFPVGTYI